MYLNEAVIPHYRSAMVPTNKLKKRILLNEKYLKEKPTWYEIDGKLQYFKIRNDFRLFTEQFFSMFGKEIMDLDTVDYKVAYIRTINPLIKTIEEETKCGLLSENFQESGYNYYLVSELMNAEISDFIAFGNYSLKSLLEFFKIYLTEDDYKVNELFLIKLFISDAFTHQEDRNYHNIGFKIPSINGITYSQRLHPEILLKHKNAKDNYEYSEDNRIVLKGLSPTKVYDNERILGTDHKNVFTYKKGQIWMPLFAYSEDTLFTNQMDAEEVSKIYEGLDPNLFELYTNHEEICKPLFERLAYDDEYKKILERFRESNSQIKLKDSTEERITKIFEDKRQQFKKILKY